MGREKTYNLCITMIAGFLIFTWAASGTAIFRTVIGNLHTKNRTISSWLEKTMLLTFETEKLLAKVKKKNLIEADDKEAPKFTMFLQNFV
jgi:hypothetical protein